MMELSIYIVQYVQGESKKKWDLKNNGHNSFEIHQKGKNLVCFGKFSINAARQAQNSAEMAKKHEVEVGNPPLKMEQI